eukprot:gene15634-21740_t
MVDLRLCTSLRSLASSSGSYLPSSEHACLFARAIDIGLHQPAASRRTQYLAYSSASAPEDISPQASSGNEESPAMRETVGEAKVSAEETAMSETVGEAEDSAEAITRRLKEIARKIQLNSDYMVHGDCSHKLGMAGELASRQTLQFQMNLAQHRLDMKKALEAKPLKMSLMSATRLSLGQQQQH